MASVLRGGFVTLTSHPFPFFPQERRVGETLERKPWVVGNRSKKKKKQSILRRGRGRGRDRCPSGGASSSGGADAEEESRNAHRTLELLPGSELQCSGCCHRSSHTVPGCGYLELFRTGPSWRKLPAVCREQNVVGSGQVK